MVFRRAGLGFVLVILAGCAAGLAPAVSERLVVAPRTPSLRVPSDRDAPYWAGLVVSDAVGWLRGAYTLRIERCLTPSHAVWGAVGWHSASRAGGEVGAGYHLWPMGQGLHGFWLGPAIWANSGARGAAWEGQAGLEGGLSYVAPGIAVGTGGAWLWRFRPAGSLAGQLRVMVWVGRAWM